MAATEGHSAPPSNKASSELRRIKRRPPIFTARSLPVFNNS